MSSVALVLEGPTSDDDWVVVFHEMRALWPDALLYRESSGEAIIFKDQGAFRTGLGEGPPKGQAVTVKMLEDRIQILCDGPPHESHEVAQGLYESLVSFRGEG